MNELDVKIIGISLTNPSENVEGEDRSSGWCTVGGSVNYEQLVQFRYRLYIRTKHEKKFTIHFPYDILV